MSTIEIATADRQVSATAGKELQILCQLKSKGVMDRNVKLSMAAKQADASEGAPEWEYSLIIPPDKEAPPGTIRLHGGTAKPFRVKVNVPKGVAYGDRLDVMVSGAVEGDPQDVANSAISVTAKHAIFSLKVSIGHERTVADSIDARARQKDIQVYAVLAPDPLRGYVLVEAMNYDKLREATKYVKRAKNIVEGESDLKDVEHYLTPKPTVEGINPGDIVELISGPFRSEKARVINIDPVKEEITVELLEAMMTIPVTVKGDSVKLIDRGKAKEGADGPPPTQRKGRRPSGEEGGLMG
ncbi:MAG TPA: transcription elongation factor Spt5 [Thermoplasmata archaeon]|nr:transcription elongation factor Spt5 [Thermoplasmata archaeon]